MQYKKISVLSLALLGLIACEHKVSVAPEDQNVDLCKGYPQWTGDRKIEAGERMLFNGTLYAASNESSNQSPLEHAELWNATACVQPQADATTALKKPLQAWKLVWQDEFDGTALDEAKWSFEVQGPGWVNNELQNYTDHRPENVRVENGNLVIEGRRDGFNGHEFSSGRIKTQGKINWKYGRMEARLKLPGGKGTWPAFWMMPEDCSRGWPACGEIDIMEHVGYDPDVFHASLHSKAYNGMNGATLTSSQKISGALEGFHVFAIEWFPDRLEAFVDGKRFFSYRNSQRGEDVWPYDKEFYIILNLAIGGKWGGANGVDKNIWPRQYLVDYVRVYQKDDPTLASSEAH